MESYKIENLTFTYPNRKTAALSDINLSVKAGEFITICGKSGCGKTTLLRLMKTALSPNGKLDGRIWFFERELGEVEAREQASRIGFLQQNPDNNIVTDKVWHELAFGPESLGLPTHEIRVRVSEMASFFGIQEWFYKKVSELSGGQKQILSLASIMVMQPSVLILDEPTSRLDPIAAQEFLNMLLKINRETGTTVILAEHRLEEALPVSDKVIVMDRGRITAEGEPRDIPRLIKDTDMYKALPTPMLVYSSVENNLQCPLNVREGREWLEEYAKNNNLRKDFLKTPKSKSKSEPPAVELKDVWFRYEKNGKDVLKGLNLRAYRGELLAVVGGNGTGKTTAMSVISGINIPYSGSVKINGIEIGRNHSELYSGIIGVLPQNPQTLFTQKSVYTDLAEAVSGEAEKEKLIQEISELCRIGELLDYHPYDLSGGEQQRAALAKVLLKKPSILILDEPTNGMDAYFKEIFAGILASLKEKGVTVIMVSHDIEFCAEYADRCAMFFDGNITSEGIPRTFFAGNSFYTTAANRMARFIMPTAVLTNDIISACGGRALEKRKEVHNIEYSVTENTVKKEVKKQSRAKLFTGAVFAVIFVLTCIFGLNKFTDYRNQLIQLATLAELAVCLVCFTRKKDIESLGQKEIKKLGRDKLAALLFVLLAVPITIWIGIYCFGDRKYYFISLLIILETLIPFFVLFEKRKAAARELVIISVMCALAVVGRSAFFMLPQFKPMAAIIIIAAAALGAETGFFVGAVSAFVSNFFFGQGPWTPWQMLAFGLIGFAAGILFGKGIIRKTRVSLAIFGFAAVFVIYGSIMNISSVVTYQAHPDLAMIISACVMGAPFDLIHAASTAFFMWFISEEMIEKIERIRIKYDI